MFTGLNPISEDGKYMIVGVRFFDRRELMEFLHGYRATVQAHPKYIVEKLGE